MSDKRGVSLMVSYVLLIAITISLSILVFNWLKPFAESEDAPSCPSGVHLVIDSHVCANHSNGILNVTLKNKGRFTVEDFVLRVNNRPNAGFGIYTLDPVAKAVIAPSLSVTMQYFVNQTVNVNTTLTLIDVQPMVDIDGKTVFCKSFATQKVNCP